MSLATNCRLPPETRAQQARLFNAEDSGYDVLVASDAVFFIFHTRVRAHFFVLLSRFLSASISWTLCFLSVSVALVCVFVSPP